MKTMTTTKKMAAVLLAGIMTVSFAACGKSDPSGQSSTETQGSSQTQGSAQAQKMEAFPKFQGKDFNGNDVDNSLFAKNEATLLNFWFNGCSACVNEMPALEKFNAKLKEKGAELIGVNVEVGEDEKVLEAAKEILAKQGVTYRNLVIDEKQEARSYMAKIFSFPTTILVDKNGNIVGQPILGDIEDEKRMNEILQAIDDLKAGKDTSASLSSEDPMANNPEAALLAEENDIFFAHRAMWDKLFAKIPKDQTEQSQNMPYAEFLKSQLEASKDSFSEEELKTMNEDLKKIAELEEKIQKLNQK